MTRAPPTVRADDVKDRERLDEARARREAEILVNIADIEKAVVAEGLLASGHPSRRELRSLLRACPGLDPGMRSLCKLPSP